MGKISKGLTGHEETGVDSVDRVVECVTDRDLPGVSIILISVSCKFPFLLLFSFCIKLVL